MTVGATHYISCIHTIIACWCLWFGSRRRRDDLKTAQMDRTTLTSFTAMPKDSIAREENSEDESEEYEVDIENDTGK